MPGCCSLEQCSLPSVILNGAPEFGLLQKISVARSEGPRECFLCYAASGSSHEILWAFLRLLRLQWMRLVRMLWHRRDSSTGLSFLMTALYRENSLRRHGLNTNPRGPSLRAIDFGQAKRCSGAPFRMTGGGVWSIGIRAR